MNTRKVKQAAARAEKLESRLHDQCSIIAMELQPFFAQEITVEFQSGDGLVVVWEDNVHLAPNNVPIQDILARLKKNTSAFL